MIEVKCICCSQNIAETSKYCPYCGRKTTYGFRAKYTGGFTDQARLDKSRSLALVHNKILHTEKSLLNIPKNGSVTQYIINGGITQVLVKFGNVTLLLQAYEKAYMHGKELKLSCPMGNSGTGFCIYERIDDAIEMLRLTKSLENRPNGIGNSICAICEYRVKKNDICDDTYYYVKFTQVQIENNQQTN